MKFALTFVYFLVFNLYAQIDNQFVSMKPKFLKSDTFNYTGSIQQWTVPNNVSKVFIKCYGAQGGDFSTNAQGGKGGFVSGTLLLSPGSTIYLTVGGKPTDKNAVYGFGGNGGFTTTTTSKLAYAGGGLSCVSSAVPISHTNLFLVAGGGGGGSAGFGGPGGNAGGLTGSDGTGQYSTAATRGFGGSQSAGGSAGTGFDQQHTNPTSGLALKGGNGGVVSTSTWSGGGGGGAGYYGGGGGAGGGNAVGSGGGGSSFANSSVSNSVISSGLNIGHGKIIIYY